MCKNGCLLISLQLNEFGISLQLISYLKFRITLFNHILIIAIVWENCNKGLSQKLQRLQNRAAGTLMSASYDSNLDDFSGHWGGEDSTIKE